MVLQDDQTAAEENEATGLLTSGSDIGRRKTRIAAEWLDALDWATSIVERRHYGDIPLLKDDPAILITGLDEPTARVAIAQTGFEYMIDAGIGHGPVDFEGLQMRILKRGVNAAAFWSSPGRAKDVDGLLESEAYRLHAEVHDKCGTMTLASASVSVPFVGAATGALTIAQAIRLASMQSTLQMMQMELGSPSMAMFGAMNEAPAASFGSIQIDFE